MTGKRIALAGPLHCGGTVSLGLHCGQGSLWMLFVRMGGGVVTLALRHAGPRSDGLSIPNESCDPSLGARAIVVVYSGRSPRLRQHARGGQLRNEPKISRSEICNRLARYFDWNYDRLARMLGALTDWPQHWPVRGFSIPMMGTHGPWKVALPDSDAARRHGGCAHGYRCNTSWPRGYAWTWAEGMLGGL